MAQESPQSPARRTVLAGAGLAGVATVLTACGSGGTSTASSDQGGASAPATGQPPAGGGSSAAAGASSGSGSGGGTTLAAVADVPVGGGKVFPDQKVVVTQPSAGQFKAFTAICTHAGCTVGSVSDGTINCPCHGSKYHIADGTVAQGPAPAPLAAMSISVNNGEIALS
ncbi:Rieske 2Fe-2S domain-containing protein [Streptacidiphilus sp. EB129]|uniref:Rieske (2Fe-2S) protein n=1 Tax=Streptacidiphilus sp. EB129 TaxID=3156262 RepID=UPI0035186330